MIPKCSYLGLYCVIVEEDHFFFSRKKIMATFFLNEDSETLSRIVDDTLDELQKQYTIHHKKYKQGSTYFYKSKPT